MIVPLGTRPLAGLSKYWTHPYNAVRNAGVMDELAQQFGFSYSTVAADIDEKAIRVDDPSDLVMALAHAKAAAILSRWVDEDALPAEGGEFRFLGRCFAILLH